MYNSRLVRVCRPKGKSPMYSLEVKADGLTASKRFSLKTRDPREADQLAASWDRKLSLIEAGEAPREMLTRVLDLETLVQRYADHQVQQHHPANSRKVFRTASQWLLSGGARTIADINENYWDRIVAVKLAEGVAGQTLATYHGVLSGWAKWCVARGLIVSSPFTAIPRPTMGDRKFRRDLTPDEIRRILEVSSEEDRLRWLLYGYTGGRGSSILHLTWAQVDLSEGIVRFPPSTNKSSKDLTLPLHTSLLEALRERRLANPEDTLVLPVVARETVYRRLIRYCGEAQVPTEGVCLHSLRHTFAALLYEASGKDIRAVQELLGHSSPVTTAAYLGVGMEKKRMAVDAMPKF